jgi:hypothetical protein
MKEPLAVDLLLLVVVAIIAIVLDRVLSVSGRSKALEAREPKAEGTPICPSCCRPIPELVHFCPHCRMPLTGYAATGPIECIATEGELFRRFVTHSSRVALVGLWVLVLVHVGVFVAALATQRGWAPLGYMPNFLVLGIFVAFLVRATRRYRESSAADSEAGKPVV